MPTFDSQELLSELEKTVLSGIDFAQSLQAYDDNQLRQRPATNSWSIVEILEHLNYYATFYTHAIHEAMAQSHRNSSSSFKSGLLGNYFTNIIGPAPKDGELQQKMSSPQNSRPDAPDRLQPQEVLTTYLAHQDRIIQLLHEAHSKNLGRTRVPISLTRRIKLKLGDTFRFLIAHQERHQQQIERCLLQFTS